MFDFQKLTVYQRTKLFVHVMDELVRENKFDRSTNDQLKRASLSVLLNIAEGSSRFSKKERRHYMVISRGSVFECVAILEYLTDTAQLSKEKYDIYLQQLEELSKMLYSLIRKFSEEND